MQRDSIDFGREDVSKLFVKMFVPTLLGMVFSSTINIADGIFVGRGVGSLALAAVNITAPLFMLTTGVALMFGCGGSIVAAIHLARGNGKASRICTTQAFTVSFLLLLLLSAAVLLWQQPVARLLGGTPLLMADIRRYMLLVVPSLPFTLLLCVGMFFIRLDGSPTYSMLCEVLPASLNVLLDWLFIFPLQWGIGGAAAATAISQVVGSGMVVGYMLFRTRSLHFYMPKFTGKALRLTCRNVGYMVRNGVASLIGELAISCVILVGNLRFVHLLGEDGVAAYSVASFCLPIIFMVGNAIAQSGQPILSYNFGRGLQQRVSDTFHIEVRYAVVGGLLLTLLGVALCRPLAMLFLQRGTQAYAIAVRGLPWFATGFIFTTVNLMYIGYVQSLEQTALSCIYMLLRGFLFVVPLFLLLPLWLGTTGLWLAVPTAELLTTLTILIDTRRHRP